MVLSKKFCQLLRNVTMLFCFLLILSGNIQAQEINISGKVTDSQGEPVVGAYITLVGTRVVAAAGLDGSFTIKAPQNGRLTISSLGYVEQTVPISGRSIINIVLEDDVTALDEVVMIAWGSQKKEHLTGAISVVDVNKSLESRPITDVGRALQGSSPGLIVTTTEGSLGGNPTIRIRGSYSTIGGGTGAPLIIVDNVEVPSLAYVNSDDIESISILKDASTTAVYGARAAFGAVLITTKKGSTEDGSVRVNYSSNFSWATPTNVPQHTRADLGMQYSMDQMNALKETPTFEYGQVGYYYNPDVIAKTKQWIDTYGDGKSLGREMVEGRDFDYRTSGGVYYYRPWDIYDIYYKDWTPQQNHNLSVAGNKGGTRYNISVGYLNQKGILKLFDDFYKRANVSGSVSTDVKKWLTVRANYFYSKSDSENPFTYASSTYPSIYYLYRWHQTYPYGTYKGVEFRGGVNDMKSARPVEQQDNWSRYGVGATLNIIDGLTVNLDYTYTLTNVSTHTVGGYVYGIDQWSVGANKTFDDLMKTYTSATYDYAQYTMSKNMRNAYNANINYTKKIKENHSIGVTAGTNIEDAEYVYVRARRNGVFDFDKGEVNLAGGDQVASSNHSWWSVVGFFARANYSYKEKYLLELNGRYDGSSKFAAGKRWGFFPSMSAAWRVSEEPWMQPIKNVVNSLKLRGSYGSVGNQDVPLASYIPTIGLTTPSASGNYWLTNGNFAQYVGHTAAGVPALVDPSLTWETVTTLDFGLDARFLNDKFGLTVDWYSRVTSDMLVAGVTIPSTVGASAPRRNYGELTTNGIEIELNFNHTFSNGLHLSLSGQYTDYKTVVTKFASQNDPLISSTYYQGKVLGEIWGYRSNGLFQNEDFQWENGSIKTKVLPNGRVTYVLADGVADQTLYESGLFKYAPGDVRFKDLNGDGVIDYGSNTVNDPGDRTVIGNTMPRHQFGFRIGANWKGFDLDVFFQGVGSRSVWATGNMTLPGWYGAEANFAHTLDYWTPENTDAFYPRPLEHGNASKWNYLPTDRYLLNLSYVRLKNLNLGYTLPSKTTKKVGIQRLRVYLSGENLFELDNMGNIPIDPELNWTSTTQNDGRSYGRSYPYRRTLSFGIQLQF